MSVPDYQTLMRPLLALFAEGYRNVAECLPQLQKRLNIADADAQTLLPSGKQTILSNRAHWARAYMAKADLLKSEGRNHHVVTEKGHALLAEHPNRIDNTILQQSEAFQNWKTAEQVRLNTIPQEARPQNNTVDTPEDRVSAAYSEIESALSSEVIDAVLSLSPARFEKLVVDLLLAMGYGGGILERGYQTQVSADGGIDGIINEDELGLDAVYIQAKRYARDNKVGRPALNAFVGSLTGEGATKGVFVTTSDFSREAISYVDRVQHRIVLINGERLARLMIKHEVGVRARKTYVLRSVDDDYFSDES